MAEVFRHIPFPNIAWFRPSGEEPRTGELPTKESTPPF